MSCQNFDLKLIQPDIVILSKHDDCYSLELNLKAFIFDQNIIDTSIKFSEIELPTSNLEELIGLKMQFSDEESQIFDGCLTLNHVHIPVDLMQIEFVQTRENTLKAIMKLFIDFESTQTNEYLNLELIVNANVASTIL